MAVIEIPSSMNKRLYNVNGADFVLPLENMKENTLNPTCFAVSYELEKDAVNDFEAVAKNYTENENLYMGYWSKKQLKEKFSGLLVGISALGIAMSGVIAFIGILNFINSFRYFSDDYFADMCVQVQALEKWQYVRRRAWICVRNRQFIMDGTRIDGEN